VSQDVEVRVLSWAHKTVSPDAKAFGLYCFTVQRGLESRSARSLNTAVFRSARRGREFARSKTCDRVLSWTPQTNWLSKSRLVRLWCLYCTKLAPISKIADVPRAERVVALN